MNACSYLPLPAPALTGSCLHGPLGCGMQPCRPTSPTLGEEAAGAGTQGFSTLVHFVALTLFLLTLLLSFCNLVTFCSTLSKPYFICRNFEFSVLQPWIGREQSQGRLCMSSARGAGLYPPWYVPARTGSGASL